tara:strand:+ start:151 stop:645 length:495 start_codon:yes stop_codon:yes gene_type:complete
MDGSGPSKIKQVPAGIITKGFTDAYVVNFNNSELLAQGTDNTDELITLFTTPANSAVTRVRVVVTVPFAGITACNISVGDADGVDHFIAAVSVLDELVVENTGAELDTKQEIEFNTATKAFNINFDPASNGDELQELTAGQLIVLVEVVDADDYASLAALITAS